MTLMTHKTLHYIHMNINKKEVKNLSLKSNDWRYRMVDIDSFLFETEPPNIETVQLEILNGIRDPVFGKKSFIDAVLSSY